jgi:SAM-dependent methyltransferase
VGGWNDPETATYYEAFCQRHSRYQRANKTLIAHARIEPGMRVLDFAAGTGRTTEAALESLGEDGRAVCVEPFEAMRAEGMRRIIDPRVEWIEALPDTREFFDRILCGAAIWQMDPIRETFQSLANLLRPGGALCFNIPALYLQEPDEPGGGSDPWLVALPMLLFSSANCSPVEDLPLPQPFVPLRPRRIGAWLKAAGFRGRSWSFRERITQDSYADWLKLPVLTERMLGKFTPKERAARIEIALESVDRSSWKWEKWRGWTAWKL